MWCGGNAKIETTKKRVLVERIGDCECYIRSLATHLQLASYIDISFYNILFIYFLIAECLSVTILIYLSYHNSTPTKLSFGLF